MRGAVAEGLKGALESELKARERFLDYVLYVSFFAQLVAGPIERAGRLLPQIENERRFSLSAHREGLHLALWGAFKKLVIADSLAPFVDKCMCSKIRQAR